ncbi:MAG: energy transducer TonB [Opitutales bacterium]|nr:energy transducer TonB [Opitutales bacterium]
MRLSYPIVFLGCSITCHVLLYLTVQGTPQTYRIQMDKATDSIAVDIVAITPKTAQAEQALEKPVEQQQVLSTRKSEEKVEQKEAPKEKPEPETVPENPVEAPSPTPEKPVERVEQKDVPPQAQTETAESTQPEQVVPFQERTDELHGAYTEAYPVSQHCPAPRYPMAARERNQQGKVVLVVFINEDGAVKKVRISESSGHKVLDRCAVKTVLDSWQFEPARRGDKRLASSITVEVSFRLN